MRAALRIAALVAVGAVLAPGAAQAATPAQDIASAGPLEHIYVGNELSCQVKLVGDTDQSFYPPTAAPPADCGAILVTAAGVYIPDFVNHTVSAAKTRFPTGIPYTPVSQTPVGGAGTNEDPLAVTTVVDAGATGLRVSQRDSYQPGEGFYTTEITVTNTAGSAQSATLYRGGDCYLANRDFGHGLLTPQTGGVYCSKNPNNNPTARLIGFVPFDPATALEAQYIDLWEGLTGGPLANACRCNEYIDNAIALGWELQIPAGGSVTRRLISTVSASGVDDDPPETSITAGPGADSVLAKTAVDFAFAADEPGARYECSLDGGEFAACSTPFTTPVLEDGGHRFSVRAIDAAGNADPTPATRDFATLTKPCAGRTVTIFARFGQELIEGTKGDDVILGTPTRDVVDAGPGDDAVCDREGDDEIAGGPGDDKLRGGTDDDTIKAGAGDDILSGRDGDDTLAGGPGKDFLNGNPGADRLNGGGGKDKCKGGSGSDRETACESG